MTDATVSNSVKSPVRIRSAPPLNIVDFDEFLQTEFRPREYCLEPWLPAQGLAMVYSIRGIGKTFFALYVAYTVASGTSFLGWPAPKPRGVLLLDGEMQANVLQERLARIVKSYDYKPQAP